ncbi:hypothetical protein E2C01_054429 [Portunus trituberculatus]|uniref:Uncharacterized protein n=1 Tax=Portunus trituberculatus TaxID=210409 RepID=A0A5B7GSN1_PORTR|nr:hypothetical protein [Portunus trituberculatus]
MKGGDVREGGEGGEEREGEGEAICRGATKPHLSCSSTTTTTTSSSSSSSYSSSMPSSCTSP